MSYNTYIFDLDGTLLNTLDDLATSCNYALRSHNMPERSMDEVRRFVGNGIRKLIERAVPEGTPAEQVEAVLATFQAYYLQHSLDSTRPYNGIQQMLATLHTRGCRLAVVSNKFMTATADLVSHFFGDYIDVAIGENEAAGILRKPAPDTVLEALHRLGVGREGTVYVGDSDVDLATARNSGIPCISVLWGFRDRDFLLAHGATTFASTPAQVPDILP